MDKKKQLELIRQYRPLLYLFFEDFSTYYKYTVVGGASLEFLVNNSFIVDTFDVDIHIWRDNLHILTTNQQKQEMQGFDHRLRSWFTSEKFLSANRGINTYFQSVSETKLFYKSFVIPGTQNNNPTYRVQIYGVDIADIRYKYEDPTKYFLLYKIPTLTLDSYFYSQVEIFSQRHNQHLLLDRLIRSPNLDDLGKQIYHSYQTAKPFHKAEKYKWATINKYLDNVAKSMVHNIIDPHKHVDMVTKKRLDDRYFKTCRRIAIMLTFFNTHLQFNKIQFYFKQDWSSCSVLNIKKILNTSDPEVVYCNNKIVFSDNLTTQAVTKLNKKLLDTTDPKFRFANFQVSFKDIWRWTASSTDITNECKAFYLKSLLGIPHVWNPSIKDYIQRLQYLLFQNRYSHDLNLYKTSRVIIFKENVDSLSIPKYSSIFQYFFNSTTTNPNLPTLLNFSGYEVGACAYTINVPANFPCIYVGSNLRSKYPNEQEIILPFGIEFRIKEVWNETYIKKGNKYYKLRTYGVDAVRPSQEICTENGTILWENLAKVIRNSNNKLTNMPEPFISATPQVNCPSTDSELFSYYTTECMNFMKNTIFHVKTWEIILYTGWVLFKDAVLLFLKSIVIPSTALILKGTWAGLRFLLLCILRASISGLSSAKQLLE